MIQTGREQDLVLFWQPGWLQIPIVMEWFQCHWVDYVDQLGLSACLLHHTVPSYLLCSPTMWAVHSVSWSIPRLLVQCYNLRGDQQWASEQFTSQIVYHDCVSTKTAAPLLWWIALQWNDGHSHFNSSVWIINMIIHMYIHSTWSELA